MKTAVESTISVVSDEILVEEYLSGNLNSFAELYNRYYCKVYKKCISFANDMDDAKDLTQDILMKCFERIDTYQNRSRFSTWLYSITKNHCIEYFRKNKRINYQHVNFRLDIEDESVDFEEQELMEARKFDIFKILDEISGNDKELLMMKYFENCTIKEIQNVHNLSASAVKMRLQRARQKVEKMYNNNVLSLAG